MPPIATIIFWATLALVIIAALFGFLGGISRGFKRSVLHTVFILAAIVISLLLTKVIITPLLNIDISFITGGGPTTVADYIISLLPEQIMQYATLKDFIMQVPYIALGPVMFMLLMMLSHLLMTIIYAIVARIAFGTKKRDFKENGNKPHRLAGGLVGMIESFVFLVMIFAPVFALTKTAEDIAIDAATLSQIEEQKAATQGELYILEYEDPNAQDENPEEESNPLAMLFDENGRMKNSQQLLTEYLGDVAPIIYEFNHSPLGACCNIGGLSTAVFDKLSAVEVNGEKIVVRKELVNIVNTFNQTVEIYNKVISLDTNSTLDINSIKESLADLLENGLLKGVIVGTLEDFIRAYQYSSTIETEYTPIDKIVKVYDTKLKDETFDLYEYIKHDIKKFLDIAGNVFGAAQEYSKADVDKTSLSVMAGYFEDAYKDSIDSVFDLNIVKDLLPIGLEYAKDALDAQLDEMYGTDRTIDVNLDVTAADLSTMFKGEFDVLKLVLEIDDYIDLFKILSTTIIVNNEEVVDTQETQNPEEPLLSDETLAKLRDNTGKALINIGKILDIVSGEKLFNYTIDEKEYNTFTELLTFEGIVLLGDTVTDYTIAPDGVMTTNEKLLTLDNYEKVMTYLSKPVDALMNADVAKILIDLYQNAGEEEAPTGPQDEVPEETPEDQTLAGFADMMTQIIEIVKQDKALLGKVVAPLLELDETKIGILKEDLTIDDPGVDTVEPEPEPEEGPRQKVNLDEVASLREVVEFYFNTAAGQFASTENITFEDVTDKEAENYVDNVKANFTKAYDNFASFGTLLVLLDNPYDAETSYLEAILEQKEDMLVVLKKMAEDETLSALLETVLSYEIYGGLVDYVFDTVEDQVIGALFDTEREETLPIRDGFAGNYANRFEDGKATVYATALSQIISVDFDKLQGDTMLETIGEVLDYVKDAAEQDAMKELYELLVWYMSSDVIFGSGIYFSDTTTKLNVITPDNENYADIQTYLHNLFKKKIAEKEDKLEESVSEAEILAYYLDPDFSFKAVMADIQDMLKLATKLMDSINDKVQDFQDINPENVDEVKQAVGDTIAELLGKTEDGQDPTDTYTAEEVVSIVENMADVAESYLPEIFESQEYEECKEAISGYLDAEEGGLKDAISDYIQVEVDTSDMSPEEAEAAVQAAKDQAFKDIQDALKALFGITDPASAALAA